MSNEPRSQSPKIILRISDGRRLMRQVFADYGQARTSAEAYARDGFLVDMMSATGRFLMDFEPLSASAAAWGASNARGLGGEVRSFEPLETEKQRKPWNFGGRL